MHKKYIFLLLLMVSIGIVLLQGITWHSPLLETPVTQSPAEKYLPVPNIEPIPYESATMADLLPFVVTLHSKQYGKPLHIDTAHPFEDYVQYLAKETPYGQDVATPGTLDHNSLKEKLEYNRPISRMDVLTLLYRTMPELTETPLAQETTLGLFNTQDALGQYALKLCNAGILQEQQQDYHWYRAMTQPEFADMVDRFYEPSKRAVSIVPGFTVRPIPLSPEDNTFVEVLQHLAIIKSNGLDGIYDLDKNQMVYQKEGNGIGYLFHQLFAHETPEGIAIIDGNGNCLFQDDFSYVSNFADGFFVVAYRNDHEHLYCVDQNGNVIQKIPVPNDISKSEWINTGKYIAIQHNDDRSVETYHFQNNQWGSITEYHHMYAIGDDTFLGVDTTNDRLIVMDATLSPKINTQGRFVFPLRNGYYWINIDTPDASTIEVVDASGTVRFTKTVPDFDQIQFYPLRECTQHTPEVWGGDGILFTPPYGTQTVYTSINMCTSTMTSLYLSDTFSLDYLDVGGRRLLPENAHLCNMEGKINTKWIYEYEGQYYWIDFENNEKNQY